MSEREKIVKELHRPVRRNYKRWSYKMIGIDDTCNLKASICERFNRTLKEKIWQRFTLSGNNKWLDILDNLVASFNDSTHRTINLKPKDVNSHNEEEIERRYELLDSKKKKKKNKVFKAKYKVGDKVRVSRVKHLFEKSYTPSWSTEIFTIQEVMKTYLPTYRLKDQDSKPISGIFYEQEIYKTNHPDVYLIEKIVKNMGDRFFVKWLGFGNEHNSWMNKDDYK
ncbi:hypothetical protein TKK_0007837 [Trichogramma kaykai]